MKIKGKKAKIPLIFIFMLLLLLLLLSFSSLPCTFSFPSSRRRSGLMKKNKSISDVDDDENIWMQHHSEFQKKERMDREEEIEDYTGTGANNHHDPGSPPATTS
ncbi:hypothetical protein ABFS83_09G002200 [Erythranthe nasuta]